MFLYHLYVHNGFQIRFNATISETRFLGDNRAKFGFLNHLEEMDAANLYAAAEELVKVYQDDLEPTPEPGNE